MKNYNNMSKPKEQSKVEVAKENVTDKVKKAFKPVDQTENIKKAIQEQEEKIQELKNSISVYFVNRCKFLNVRDEASKDSLVLHVLENGTIIEPVIYNETTEWTKIKFKGRHGYIMTKYIGVEVSTPE